MRGENEIGLCLSGGGAKGAFQIGVFKAIEEEMLYDHITAVSGTSAGALNAALFIQGDMVNADRIWRNFNGLDFLGFDYIKTCKALFGYSISKTTLDMLGKRIENMGVFSQNIIENLLKNNVNMCKISENSIDCYITCFNLFETIKKDDFPIYLNEPNKYTLRHMQKYILASAALPIIYPPVEINGKVYNDGGVKSLFNQMKHYQNGYGNVPFDVLLNNKYKYIIVVDYEVDKVLNKREGVTFINIKPLGYKKDFWETFDFKKIPKMIDEGYWAAKKVFDENKDLLDKIKSIPVEKEFKITNWMKSKKIDNVSDFIKEMLNGSNEIILTGRISSYVKAIYSIHNDSLIKIIDIIANVKNATMASAMISALLGGASVALGTSLIVSNPMFIGAWLPFLFICNKNNIIDKFFLYELYESRECDKNCVILYKKKINN